MIGIDPDWNLYRSFLAVIEEGSLSGAARSLGLAQPSVGRHIDALESAVGFQLFIRSQHGLTPTGTALELRPYAEALSSAAAALLRAASRQGTAGGVVRITASEVVGAEVLPPILAALRRSHPGIIIELALSNAVENLLRHDADIAVRMVEPRQDALLVRRVGVIPVGLHAHRDYLARHGTPRSLDDLGAHSLIGYDRETPAIRSMRREFMFPDRALFALRADSDLAQLAAIRAGFGIGGCQTKLALREPNLVRVLPDSFEMKLGTWLAMHENLRSAPHCRVVFDALFDGLKDYADG